MGEYSGVERNGNTLPPPSPFSFLSGRVFSLGILKWYLQGISWETIGHAQRNMAFARIPGAFFFSLCLVLCHSFFPLLYTWHLPRMSGFFFYVPCNRGAFFSLLLLGMDLGAEAEWDVGSVDAVTVSGLSPMGLSRLPLASGFIRFSLCTISLRFLDDRFTNHP